jgi:iron complex transport system substrate-binding protein
MLAASRFAAAALPTVASTNLCADLLLLALAAPEQIVSVSAAAQDPAQSPVAAVARNYPVNRGRVEELLYLKPSIALVHLGWTGRRHADLLAAHGIRVESLPFARDWAQTLELVREIAALIGRAEHGREVAAAADARMRALASGLPSWRVLYLRPNGGTAGSGTHIDDLLNRLGLRNLAAEQGLVGWGRYPLEQLVLTPPDLFLLGYFDQAQPPSRSAHARHPLLGKLLARIPAVALPSNGWGCGALELLDAAEHIAAEVQALAAGNGAATSQPPPGGGN